MKLIKPFSSFPQYQDYNPTGWFRRTQNITSIGLFYKNEGILLGGCLTVKN